MDSLRNWIILGLLPILAAGLLVAPAGSENDGGDLTAIREAAGHYLAGGQTGDIERLRQAFHPSARLQFVRDGSYQEWSLEEYLGKKTPGKRSNHRTRIQSIDLEGTCAVVKVELDYGSFKFIDYLSLLKTDGEWRIVNKIFFRAG